MIGHMRFTPDSLTALLRQAVGQYGPSTPVQIRADRETEHESVRRVMDACGRAGVWRVSFVAVKESTDRKR